MYKYLLELIKRRSKVQEKKNMSFERALDFDEWITFSENYKPMRVSLWLFYKSTENNCCLQLFSEFIQTQKRYPTSLDKICILTWKLIVISSQTFPCELNSQWTYFLQNISYPSLPLWDLSVEDYGHHYFVPTHHNLILQEGLLCKMCPKSSVMI